MSLLKKKSVKKVSENKKENINLVCVTCIRMNRPCNIEDGLCLTCKRGNRKQNIIEVS